MNRLKRLAWSTAGFLLRMLIVFVVIEGVCGVGIVACRAKQTIGDFGAVTVITQHDPDIGWVNIPGFQGKDIYGPGGDLHVNAHGFRLDHELDANPPAGKMRVICTGDSATFGLGVGDGKAWCDRLGVEDPRLEPAILGVHGYGIDQAYLLYEREGAPLGHDIHVFAFITDDFRRMGMTSQAGVGKPVIRLRQGHLSIENVPVPKHGFSLPRVSRVLAAFDQARSVSLLKRLRGARDDTEGTGVYEGTYENAEVALAIMDDLHKQAVAKGRVFVALYLPSEADMKEAPWRQAYLTEELGRRGVHFVDLTPEMRALDPRTRRSMYIQRGEKNDAHAPLHNSVAGHQMVGKLLYEKLRALPELAPKLSPQ